MLSRLLGATKQPIKYNHIANVSRIQQNLISKRCSGHRAMEIVPSKYDRHYTKNWFHFYFLISTIPMAVIITIINIRANPVLSEVPEGYEPREWEYYRHPIARFIARYLHTEPEKENEMLLASEDQASEKQIMKKIQRQVNTVAKFYSDHRGRYFSPVHGDRIRAAREEQSFGSGFAKTLPGVYYDAAYKPEVNPIPTEGFPEGPME